LPVSNTHGNKIETYDSGSPTRWRQSTKEEITRKQLSNILTSNSIEEILKLTFGDHTKVVVTADGIDSEEYDHD
jgi:hypothetical protein